MVDYVPRHFFDDFVVVQSCLFGNYDLFVPVPPRFDKLVESFFFFSIAQVSVSDTLAVARIECVLLE